jgi:hypothetical protein
MVEDLIKNVLPVLIFFVGVILALGVSLIAERYRK